MKKAKKKQKLNLWGKVKKIVFWTIGSIFGLFILLLIIGLMLPETSNAYKMRFFTEGTKTVLNGDVYLDSTRLGETTNGTIEIDIDELSEGEITLKWEYKERIYETHFDLEEKDFNYSGKDFYIRRDYMKDVTFDASKLDNKEIESKVLDFINTRRKNQGLNELKASSKIADSARAYAQKVASPDFKPSDKKTALEVLSKDNIFTFYADGVSYGEDLDLSRDEDYIAEQIITSWFKDPWAKEKLLEQYSDMGIGIYLKERSVAAVGFLSLNEFSVDGEMGSRQCSGAVKLYNNNMPFNKDIKVRFELESTNGISAYIVTDKDAQQDCIKRNPISSIKEYRSLKEINDEIVLPKGAGLMLKTSDYGAEYSYTIKYISWS